MGFVVCLFVGAGGVLKNQHQHCANICFKVSKVELIRLKAGRTAMHCSPKEVHGLMVEFCILSIFLYIFVYTLYILCIFLYILYNICSMGHRLLLIWYMADPLSENIKNIKMKISGFHP